MRKISLGLSPSKTELEYQKLALLDCIICEKT